MWNILLYKQEDNKAVSNGRKWNSGGVFFPSPDNHLAPQPGGLHLRGWAFWVGLAVTEGTDKLIHGWAMSCTEEDHSDHLGSVPWNRQISTIVRTLSGCPRILGPSSQSGRHENVVGFFISTFFSSVLPFMFSILMLLKTWTEQLTSGTAVSQWHSTAHFDTFRAQNIFVLCHTPTGLGLSNKVDVFLFF